MSEAIDFKVPADLANMVDGQDLGIKHGLLQMLNSKMSEYYRSFVDTHTHTIDELLEIVPEKDWPKYRFATLCMDEQITSNGVACYKNYDISAETKERLQEKMSRLGSFPSYLVGQYDPLFEELIETITLDNIHQALDFYENHVCRFNGVNYRKGQINMQAKFAVDHSEKLIYNTTPFTRQRYTHRAMIGNNAVKMVKEDSGLPSVSASDHAYDVRNNVFVLSWEQGHAYGYQVGQMNEQRQVFFDLRTNCCISPQKAYKLIYK